MSLLDRVKNSFLRGIVRLINDENSRQQLQVEFFKDDYFDGIERAQNYGFTSNPLPGADAFAIFPGGMRERGVVLVVDDRRYRLVGLQPGEVGISDDLGNKVILKRDRIQVDAVEHVEVNAPTILLNADESVTIVAPDVIVNGDTTINGNFSYTGSGLANGKVIDENHTHAGGSLGAGHTGVVD